MQYSPKHNVCVYDTDEPLRIGNCIPDARLLSHTQVAVPCTIVNMQTMRRLGYEAVSPIMYDYDWPIKPGMNPFTHQRHMASFMTLHPHCFNFSDMGTGKTLATLWALDYLMLRGIIKKALILCTLSTMEETWNASVFTHFMSRRRVSILHGDRQKRLSRLESDADFYVVNHDGLGVGSRKSNRGLILGDLAETIRTRDDIDAVVIDELAEFKDSATNKYRILRNTVSHKKILWGLTGTPTAVSPLDAHAQARLIRPEYLESFLTFRDRVMYKASTFKWVAKQGAIEAAAEVLQPAIRYHSSDCLDLPPVTVVTREVELSPAQKLAYKQLTETLKTSIGVGQINAINEVSLRTKLIQVASGAVYGEDHSVNKIDCAPRLTVLDEVIRETDHKIIVFSCLTSVISVIYSHLKQHYSVEKVDGTVSAAERTRIFRDFQGASDPRVIVAHPRTMAHGITLTAAATTIWFGPTDNPGHYQQANKRMDRPGQKNKMLIVRLAATKIEREIYRRLDAQEDMQGLLLNLIKGE